MLLYLEMFVLFSKVNHYINIFQLKMSSQDRLSNFYKMSKQSLQTLSLSQAQEYLSLLHSSQNQKQIRESRVLSKKIKRINDKKAYMKYVRMNITNIIRKSVNRVLKNKKEPSDECNNLKFNEQKQQQNNNNLINRDQNLSLNMTKILAEDKNEQFKCPICLQFLINPALTKCGHTFCFQCLDESLLFKNNCPNCRQNLKGSQIILSHLFDRLAQKSQKEFSNQQQFTMYSERVHKYQEWIKLRLLDSTTFYRDQIIDIRDTQCIWCQGTILDIYYQDNQTSSILVHFNKWNRIYNEVIDLPSTRLAPFNFFSGRVDIPRYNLAEQDDNLRGTVISGARLNEMNRNVIEIPQSSHDIQSSSQNHQNNENQVEQQEQEQQQQQQNENNGEQNDNNQPQNRFFHNWHLIRLISPSNNIRFRINGQRVLSLQLPRQTYSYQRQVQLPLRIEQNQDMRLFQQPEQISQRQQSNHHHQEESQSKEIQDEQQRSSGRRRLENNQHDI